MDQTKTYWYLILGTLLLLCVSCADFVSESSSELESSVSYEDTLSNELAHEDSTTDLNVSNSSNQSDNPKVSLNRHSFTEEKEKQHFCVCRHILFSLNERRSAQKKVIPAGYHRTRKIKSRRKRVLECTALCRESPIHITYAYYSTMKNEQYVKVSVHYSKLLSLIEEKKPLYNFCIDELVVYFPASTEDLYILAPEKIKQYKYILQILEANAPNVLPFKKKLTIHFERVEDITIEHLQSIIITSEIYARVSKIETSIEVNTLKNNEKLSEILRSLSTLFNAADLRTDYGLPVCTMPLCLEIVQVEHKLPKIEIRHAALRNLYTLTPPKFKDLSELEVRMHWIDIYCHFVHLNGNVPLNINLAPEFLCTSPFHSLTQKDSAKDEMFILFSNGNILCKGCNLHFDSYKIQNYTFTPPKANAVGFYMLDLFYQIYHSKHTDQKDPLQPLFNNLEPERNNNTTEVPLEITRKAREENKVENITKKIKNYLSEETYSAVKHFSYKIRGSVELEQEKIWYVPVTKKAFKGHFENARELLKKRRRAPKQTESVYLLENIYTLQSVLAQKKTKDFPVIQNYVMLLVEIISNIPQHYNTSHPEAVLQLIQNLTQLAARNPTLLEIHLEDIERKTLEVLESTENIRKTSIIVRTAKILITLLENMSGLENTENIVKIYSILKNRVKPIESVDLPLIAEVKQKKAIEKRTFCDTEKEKIIDALRQILSI